MNCTFCKHLVIEYSSLLQDRGLLQEAILHKRFSCPHSLKTLTVKKSMGRTLSDYKLEDEGCFFIESIHLDLNNEPGRSRFRNSCPMFERRSCSDCRYMESVEFADVFAPVPGTHRENRCNWKSPGRRPLMSCNHFQSKPVVNPNQASRPVPIPTNDPQPLRIRDQVRASQPSDSPIGIIIGFNSDESWAAVDFGHTFTAGTNLCHFDAGSDYVPITSRGGFNLEYKTTTDRSGLFIQTRRLTLVKRALQTGDRVRVVRTGCHIPISADVVGKEGIIIGVSNHMTQTGPDGLVLVAVDLKDFTAGHDCDQMRFKNNDISLIRRTTTPTSGLFVFDTDLELCSAPQEIEVVKQRKRRVRWSPLEE